MTTKPLKIATEQTLAMAKWLNFNTPKTRHNTYRDKAEFWPVIYISFFDEEDEMLFMMKFAGTIPEIVPRHWREDCGNSLSALQWLFSKTINDALNGIAATLPPKNLKSGIVNGKWTNPKASIKSARQARVK